MPIPTVYAQSSKQLAMVDEAIAPGLTGMTGEDRLSFENLHLIC